MFNQFIKPLSMLFAAFGISLALTTNCYALFLTTSTSTSFFKSVASNADLACKADDGEMSVDASINPGETDSFVMESSIDTDSESPTYGQRISHTCCEVPHDSGLSVADCEAGDENGDPLVDENGLPVCSCGEFTLDQKVEDYTADGIDQGDNVPSNCLQAETDVTGNLETYRCQVSNGAPKETWVWHLVPVAADESKFCDDTCAAGCGVAIGTTANAKPGDYPYGTVWQYSQYRDPADNNNILLANFQGNACHTGSFCLADDIQCEVKSAKLNLRTDMTANFTIVEVDTVQTFNGNSTSGKVPTDFLSTTSDGTLLVDPTEVDTASITLNGRPVTVDSSTINSDRNDDLFPDLRTHISQASYQQALFPLNDCVAEEAKAIMFRGTFIDGSAWIGPTTVDVVCN